MLADVVDEDFVNHSRTSSMSTLIFGMNAFFTKPGQSFAPMLGTFRPHCYENLLSATDTGWVVLRSIGYSEDGNSREGPVTGDSRDVMFKLLITLPFLCAVVQTLLWSRFSLRGTYLKQIKMKRMSREDV